jgi:hypothetical protein
MGMGRQTGTSALAACLLAACSAGTPADAPAADTSEPAETPAETGNATPWPADYAAMRTAAAGWAADELAAEAEVMARTTPVEMQAEQPFDLFSCAAPDAELADVDPRTRQLSDLAHKSVLMEARLKAAGYSGDVWAEALEALQRESLKLLDGPVPAWGAPGHDKLEEGLTGLLNQAAATMELRRQTLQPEQPSIILEGGCGAFETPFLVRADPPGGRIWVTTRFTFQTCQALGKSAWDTGQCRWTEVQPDRPSYLSGTYMVQAKWPDGRTLRSSQRFQPDPNLGDDETVPVTIRPG